MKLKIVTITSIATAAILVLTSAGFAAPKKHTAKAKSHSAAPTIKIDVVPPGGGGPDSLGTIAGHVTNAPAGSAVVIFCQTNTWYVQPYTAAPYTDIASNGTFKTDVHLGDYYACVLVRRSAYTPLDTTDELPAVDGKTVLATTGSVQAHN